MPINRLAWLVFGKASSIEQQVLTCRLAVSHVLFRAADLPSCRDCRDVCAVTKSAWDIEGKTVGTFGAGNIGRGVMERLAVSLLMLGMCNAQAGDRTSTCWTAVGVCAAPEARPETSGCSLQLPC